MFLTQTSNLPADQRQRLHADFLANEQAYLCMRDSLLPHYRGQWVAVHNGRVLAADVNLLAVTEAAAATGGHPYIALVGAEDSVHFRVRRASFAYNQGYQPFSLPQVTVTFWDHAETHAQTYGDAIPDTGADLSVLPQNDCTAIDLFNSPYFTGVSSGVVGSSVTTLIYRGKAEIDGNRYPALIQPVAGSLERIVGRDVLNQLRVLFDGPGARVVVDP
jgi:predicted aspartyl protease